MIDPDPAVRPGEITIDPPNSFDAQIYFVGRIHTPWTRPTDCPRRGDALNGPECRIDVFDIWQGALEGVQRLTEIEVLYWMHLARRDLVRQNPKRRGELFGTFSLRSPMRPNPIAASVVTVIAIDGQGLVVRGLDCVDGTPLIDLKPVQCPMWAPEANGRRA